MGHGIPDPPHGGPEGHGRLVGEGTFWTRCNYGIGKVVSLDRDTEFNNVRQSQGECMG